MQSQWSRAWKLGLTTSHGVSSPKYDMDVYMTILFGGEAHDLVLRVGLSKKLDPPLNTISENFLHNVIMT
jgi:hypothetical protein